MSRPALHGLARGAVGLAGRLAPAAVVALAERAFLTPRSPAPRPAQASSLAEASQLRIPTVGGPLPVYQWGDPRAPAVLLVHGWSGHAGQLTPWVAPLVDRGHRVVAVDLPGHGAAPTRMTHVPEMGAALGQVGRSIGPVHAVVAHSVGTMVTALALAGGLRAERLVFVAAGVRGRRWLDDFAAFFGLHHGVRERVAARVRARCGHALEDLRLEGVAPDLPPTLFLHSSDDPIAPEADARWASLEVGGDFFAFDGLGHHRILRTPAVIASGRDFVTDGRHPGRSRLSA